MIMSRRSTSTSILGSAEETVLSSGTSEQARGQGSVPKSQLYPHKIVATFDPKPSASRPLRAE